MSSQETKEKQRHRKAEKNKSAQPALQDYEFDWEQYKYYLDKIFFYKNSFIEKQSSDHMTFWNFLKKYVLFHKKKSVQKTADKERSLPSQQYDLCIPATYSSKHKVNFTLKLKPDETAIADMHGRKCEKELTEVRLQQFQQICAHYMDFIQKQKFAKLQKIKCDQENLPIYKYKKEITDAVKRHQVVVVAGDTGCGKSTQVPQYLLSAGFENIACTQPRRIACLSLSRRVSFETLNEYGSEVAYQVRFDKSRTKATKILFLTEGLLLRQISSDALLSQYSVVVIDEVHERHIHTDFLLGVVKCLLKQRSSLKLVLMSATINIDLFSSYFDNAPVVCVPGRLYPIQLQYIPISVEQMGSKTEKLDPSPYLRVLQSIDHKYPSSERGDVLMFLSGMTEIMTVVDAAKQYSSKNKRWIILPLHSALSIAEQDKVFDFPPEGVRKCIVSTNIAETSVTIDGVRFVVDSGKVKEMSFDTKYKMQKLQEFWISKASSEQRKGRAGRTGPGVCFRLYSENDYDTFQEYSTPEIHRVPLDSLVLQMSTMGLPDARRFPFIESPDSIAIENSISYLREQNALDENEELTAIGKLLAQLPVDVVIGKMLIMASLFEMVQPVLCISAALSVQTPFTVKGQRDYDAMTSRQKLQSDHGDPITLLNAFDEWIQVKAEGRDSKKWCRRRALEEQRFYEMSKLKNQFQDLLQEHGLVEKKKSGNEEKTREERKQFSTDRKRLRDLRHERKAKGKKRKILKLDDDDWEIDKGLASDTEDLEESGDIDTSIKDLEFRLTHDLSKEQSNMSRSFTLKDINILKVILCSGLYPQLAISDEYNSFKPDTEQAFHTKNKGFILLHPTSVFATNPEILQPVVVKEHEIVTKEVELKGPISNKHQLLAFVSLLETNKPYLTGTMRVPALQTLLLFSSAIDTDASCQRLVFDSWLEVCLHGTPEEAENVVSIMVRLRYSWKQLLELKLKVHERQRSLEDDYELRKMSNMVKNFQKHVSKKLAEFLECDVNYTIRRILPAEAAHLYVGTTQGDVAGVFSEITQNDGEPHPVKGGCQVTPYLTLYCLVEKDSVYGDYNTFTQQHWTCKRCNEAMIVTFASKLLHEQTCLTIQHSHKDSSGDFCDKDSNKQSIMKKSYHCQNCDKDFQFSTTEILKHRKMCKLQE